MCNGIWPLALKALKILFAQFYGLCFGVSQKSAYTFIQVLKNKQYTEFIQMFNIKKRDFKVLLANFLSTSEVLRSSCTPPQEHFHFRQLSATFQSGLIYVLQHLFSDSAAGCVNFFFLLLTGQEAL